MDIDIYIYLGDHDIPCLIPNANTVCFENHKLNLNNYYS